MDLAEDGIRDTSVTGVQTCALPILVVSAIGLYFGIQSMKDTAAVMKWKIIGCTCNGIVLAVSVIIFMIGIIAMI